MYEQLIGKNVMNRKTRVRGVITDVTERYIQVNEHGKNALYPFPSAMAETLILEDESLMEHFADIGAEASFEDFKRKYSKAIYAEIAHLRQTGGKRYRIVDGTLLDSPPNVYLYSFETDSELHLLEGAAIKLWFPEEIVDAEVSSCEGFNIVIISPAYLGTFVESVEFTSDSWMLLERFTERLNDMSYSKSPIAYQVACKGPDQVSHQNRIGLGQDLALRKCSEQQVTFIWGPPGTGKTTTLAKIALEYMLRNKRVLMVSYSNVSVDGALLRVARMSDLEPGKIIRYGYPRVQELLDSETLTAFKYVLYANPELAEEYDRLQQKVKKSRPKDPDRKLLMKEFTAIKAQIVALEVEAVQRASFVATTVSKATVDKAIFTQKFDLVIFDEASMAYIPQVVFAASLAKQAFCCLGDFRQLPAIVQRPNDEILTRDIFEHTGITYAVENNFGHNWLVMLNYQYRMHPDIAAFASKHMYEGLLMSAESIYEHRQTIANLKPMSGEPMSMVDLSSTYSVCIKTMDGSRINLMSALVCMRLAEEFAGRYEVGIITPYSAQSKLILAMVRDLREQEQESKYKMVTCATVHQFQGSEKAVIIYDAVDCFRMPFPGTLLTSKKNDTADRLFNVALTRTQGKFILVANVDYLFRKNISKTLMFTKALHEMTDKSLSIKGEDLFYKIGTAEGELSDVFLGDRDEVDSWERFLDDIANAEKEVFVDVPGQIDEDPDALDQLIQLFHEAEMRGVKIYIRTDETVSVIAELKPYVHFNHYVTTPMTIIDRNVVWFGEPLSAAYFISEGEDLETEYFPCLRFEGKHTARMLKALFEIPTIS